MAEASSRTALITGILGQDGSYLTELLVARGYAIVGTTHRMDATTTIDVSGKDVPVIPLDLADSRSIQEILERIQPDEIYNLASRSSSAQLFDDPIATAEINGLSVVRFLETIRTICPHTRFCQASSSEVFARATQSPQDEGTPFRPRNAYGAAKVFAQNMVENYRDRFGIFSCSAVLFNHESPRRGKEYVTRKITSTVARIAAGQEATIALGDLDSRRDWGFAGDYVDAMWRMLQRAIPEDYVIATGETHTVRELCELAFSHAGLDYRDHVVVDQQYIRGPESVVLCGNPSRAREQLGWRPGVSFQQLVHMMVDADCAVLARNAKAEEKQRGSNA